MFDWLRRLFSRSKRDDAEESGSPDVPLASPLPPPQVEQTAQSVLLDAGAALTPSAFEATVEALGVDPAHLWALIVVESPMRGFDRDRRPIIRYERHVFARLTDRAFVDSHPDLSDPDWAPGESDADPWAVLVRAAELRREIALRSTSWGVGQLMGFNAEELGYEGTDALVARMRRGEDEQLDGMRRFLVHHGLAESLRREAWADVARVYNGPRFAEQGYDRKLRDAFEGFRTGDLPDVDTHAMQLYLDYLGHSAGRPDGVIGPLTRRALADYLADFDTAFTLTEGELEGLTFVPEGLLDEMAAHVQALGPAPWPAVLEPGPRGAQRA